MKKRTASVAILMCAVMVLVVGAPLVTADSHHIVKGAQGPRASAVTWNIVPTDNGSWYGHIVNSGLRSLVVDVDDTSNGVPISILHQRIRFAAYPTNVVDTNKAVMTVGHTYTVTATPNGPRGTYCDVDDVMTILHPPVASFTYSVDGATVSVDASASTDSDGTIVAWGWDFGDGTTGTGVTATHTYDKSGDYLIVLTVMDNDGLTNSTSQTVTVVVPDNPPMAAFTWTADYLTVSFDASASTDDNGIADYSWQFGDAMTGNGMMVTHAYAVAGTYTVTLTVTDTIGQTNSVSHDVTVEAPPLDLPPVAAFTWTAVWLTVSFDASASTDDHGITDYSWQFGDAMTGNGMMVTHAYAVAGTYTVTLTVTDTIGQTNSVSHDVTVEAPPLDLPPVAVFTATVSGYSVSVDATLSTDDHGITSYSWNWGDGSPAGSGMTATHTYTNVPPLLKTITLTVTDTIGQTDSVSHDVTLQDNAPVAAFTATVSGYTVNVDASASTDDHGIVSYSWNWGDGSPAGSGMTATHTYTNVPPLLKTIGLTVTDTVGLTASVSHDVTLQDDPPVAAFTASVIGYSVSVDATTSSDDHGITSYSWNWGDGSPAGSGMTATHTYTDVPPLLKTITLTVTDTVGQTASVGHDVTLQDNAPVAAFTWTADLLVVSVDGSTSSDDHGIVSWSWNWGDGSPAGSGMTATHTYGAADTYTITLTVTDTVGQVGSVSQDVSVSGGSVPPPVASFTGVAASGGKLTVDASASTAQAGIYRYDWNFGDHIISWGVTHQHVYMATGTYTVTLTVTDNLGQKTSISQSFLVVNTALPPLPYTVYGYVTSSGSPVLGASVNVTNVRTSETMIDFVTDADGLYYMDNIMPLYFLNGDTAVFAAASGGLSGSSSIILDMTGVPYLEVDISLV